MNWDGLVWIELVRLRYIQVNWCGLGCIRVVRNGLWWFEVPPRPGPGPPGAMFYPKYPGPPASIFYSKYPGPPWNYILPPSIQVPSGAIFYPKYLGLPWSYVQPQVSRSPWSYILPKVSMPPLELCSPLVSRFPWSYILPQVSRPPLKLYSTPSIQVSLELYSTPSIQVPPGALAWINPDVSRHIKYLHYIVYKPLEAHCINHHTSLYTIYIKWKLETRINILNGLMK